MAAGRDPGTPRRSLAVIKGLPGHSRKASMRSIVVTALSILTFTSRAQAETYVVDPAGGGDFTDLASAIATVAAGSTLLVSGQHYDVVIDKSLTLIGMGDAELLVTPGYNAPDLAALLIAAPPDGRVHLANFTISGGREYRTWEPHGVIVDGGRSVTFEECTIEGGRSVDLMWESCVGLPSGDGIFVRGVVGTLTVTRSAVRGGDGAKVYGDDAGSPGWDNVGCDAGDAINATAAGVVLLVDSTIEGGDGGDSEYACVDGGSGFPPSSLVGGNGGDGLVGDAYVSNCVIAGGEGGIAIDGCGFGGGEDGAAGVAIVGSTSALASRLSSSPFALNETATLGGTGFRGNSAVFLIGGSAIGGPLDLRRLGLAFVELPWLFVLPVTTDAAGSFVVTEAIPDDFELVGITLVMQATDGSFLSAPEVRTITP
jgi:hypothetical protein